MSAARRKRPAKNAANREDVSQPGAGMDAVVAIDVETANEQRLSICQIGLAWFQEGAVKTQAWLVRPPENRYAGINIGVHGIKPEMTVDASTLRKLWPDIRTHLDGRIVIAHNRAFDIDCLKKTLNHYRRDFGDRTTGCTLRMARSLALGTSDNKLPTLCEHYGIPLENHHDADADATACLLLAERLWQTSGLMSDS